MDSPVVTIIFIVVAVAGIFWIIRRQESGARDMLDAWAKGGGDSSCFSEALRVLEGPLLACGSRKDGTSHHSDG
jgi:hypothetical protein